MRLLFLGLYAVPQALGRAFVFHMLLFAAPTYWLFPHFPVPWKGKEDRPKRPKSSKNSSFCMYLLEPSRVLQRRLAFEFG